MRLYVTMNLQHPTQVHTNLNIASIDTSKTPYPLKKKKIVPW